MSSPPPQPQSGDVRTTDDGAPDGVGDMSKLEEARHLDNLELPYAVVLENLTMGWEAIGFLGHRLKAQTDFCYDLINCHNVSQVVEIQCKFRERATSEYTDEVAKVMTNVNNDIVAFAKALAAALAMTGDIRTDVPNKARAKTI